MASSVSTLTVSVIIPNYNNANFLVEAIESALAQTHAPHEIIVVDDGSTDDSLQVLARYENHPVVQVLAKQNGGVASARNAGARQATSEFLAFLDADDIWLPRKLERQIARLQSDTTIGLVHCGLRYIDRNGREGEAMVDGMEGDVGREILLWERSVIVGPGSTTVIRKAVWAEIGGYDEKLRVSEDIDFTYRIARRYKIAFVPEILLLYRQHGSNIHLNVERLESCMGRFYRKAFAEKSPQIQAVKRRAYANYHMTLAGSYWHARNFHRFFVHLAHTFLAAPIIARRLFAWVKRRFQHA